MINKIIQFPGNDGYNSSYFLRCVGVYKNWVPRFIMFIITMAALVSFFVYDKATLMSLNLTIAFELMFFVVTLSYIKNGLQKEMFFYVFLFTAYLCYSMIYSLYVKQDYYIDFIYIHKFIVYMVLIGFCIGKKIGVEQRKVKTIFKLVVVLFFVKYLLSIVVFGNFRPTLFTENNFELTFLFFLYLTVYSTFSLKENYIYLIMIGLIVAMSGSKSGIGAFFIMFIILSYTKIDKMFMLKFIGSLLFSFIFGVVLLDRLGDKGLAGIDRLKFLKLFFYETEPWGLLQWLKGSSPITPLSDETCRALSLWQTLFSQANDGVCYSVILHSFVLRVVFDHGVMGLILVTLYLLRILKKSYFSSKEIIIIMSLIVIQALSVSALNNAFVCLGIVLLLITKKEQPRTLKRTFSFN